MKTELEVRTNKELSIWEAITPLIFLISLLGINVYLYGDDSLGGANQFALLLGAAAAAIVGFLNKVTYDDMIEEISNNLKSTTGAILILLMVGALAGTWLISGVIPAMIGSPTYRGRPHTSHTTHRYQAARPPTQKPADVVSFGTKPSSYLLNQSSIPLQGCRPRISNQKASTGLPYHTFWRSPT